MSEQAMPPELLPCPFCGGPASREARNHTYETGCDNVGCSVLPSAVQLSQVAADEAWNRRATPTALAASPEVAKLIAAEAKLWERAIANYCDLITIEDVEDYVAKARAEAAAGGDA